VDHNCNDIPDAAMTAAVAALLADGPTAIRDVYNWRVKETERMKAIVAELTKLGASVEEGHDYCVITPPKEVRGRWWCAAQGTHARSTAWLAAAARAPARWSSACTLARSPRFWLPRRCTRSPPRRAHPPTPAPQVKPGVAIETYDDHRMAMAFSLVAACGVPVTILDPGCTRKTFPTYFQVFETVAKH
jgi:5-enolpyruvylshikimate-3-phosphate synthase